MREREQALELMEGQLPSALSRISELIALNPRTQKDSREQRGGQGRQIEWELYRTLTQKDRVASCWLRDLRQVVNHSDPPCAHLKK